MAALRALVIVSLAALVSVKALATNDDTKCNSCKTIMGEVKENLSKLTGEVGNLLKGTLRNVCQHYVTLQVLEEICETVEMKLLDALSQWIQKTGVVNPDLDCQYLHFCPRPKGFEVFLKMLKVPDVPALP